MPITLQLQVKIDGEPTTLIYDQWTQRGHRYMSSDRQSRAHHFPEMLVKGSKFRANGYCYEVLS